MKKMAKKIIAALLVIAMVSMLAACGSSGGDSAETSSDAEGAADEDIQVVFSTYALLSPFFVAAAYGYMEECNNLGIEPMLMEAGNNMQNQINQIDNAITRVADAIIIVPYDSDGLAVAVEK